MSGVMNLSKVWCKLGHPFELGFEIIKREEERFPYRLFCGHCGIEDDCSWVGIKKRNRSHG